MYAQYHNVIASSTTNPVFFLTLTPFEAQARESLTLCQEKVLVTSPQGSYQVKRYLYRCAVRIKAGQIVGHRGGVGGGPGGVEVVHEDWGGTLVIETEGTQEHAALVIARVRRRRHLAFIRPNGREFADAVLVWHVVQIGSVEGQPYRIMREKSRPGKLWIRPVLADEAV